MKPKIIILSMSPYEESIVHNHYFQKEFESSGYNFEYWSISKFVGFDYKEDELPFTRYFSSVKDVVKALNSEEKPFFCNIQIALIPRLYPIFKAVEQNALKFYELRYLDGIMSLVTDSNVSSTKKKLKLKNLIKRIRQKLFLNHYKKSKVKKRLILFKPPGINSDPKLEIHHFDYTIDNNITKKNIVEGDYFLFIDQGLPSHPDFKLLGLKNINKNIYLKEMNDFFNYIESKFNIPVVIAAHPKSIYNKDDFGHRKIIKYKTACLTKNAKAVFIHYTTSFNYAVLNYKPIVLLTMDEFFDSQNGTGLHTKINTIVNISKLFNSPIININKDTSSLKENLFFVDKDKYDEFKNKYLVSQCNKDLSNFEIVHNYLLNNSKI